MNERIFNLFLLINDGNIYKLGAVSHKRNGTDQDKLAFLQAKVSTDIKNMKLFQLPDRYEFVEQSTNNRVAGLKYDTFKILASTGQHLEVFEEVFQDFEASINPLVCITPIVENKLRIDKQEYLGDLEDQSKRKFQKITEATMPDYLTAYITKDGFDAPRLFNDDYFLAIKLLYKNKHYTSSLKLLMSFIDTVAYLEYGDISRNFQKWLDQYADLSQVGVNASELWEFRNSLLHMTNLDSRKVLGGKVRRIMFYVGTLPEGFPTEIDDAKIFCFMDLIKALVQAMERWSETYNTDRSKFKVFVDRYDRVISDVRYHVFFAE